MTITTKNFEICVGLLVFYAIIKCCATKLVTLGHLRPLKVLIYISYYDVIKVYGNRPATV